LASVYAGASAASPRPAIGSNTGNGVSIVSSAAGWKNYGAYIQQLIDTMYEGWNKGLATTSVADENVIVHVKFTIDARGHTSNAVVVKGTPSEKHAKICLAAIAFEKGFGEWTPGMKRDLGSEQELVAEFRVK